MIANIHPVRHAATYPTHIVGKLGWHTADTACPIGPGTWAGACAATDVAVTAAQLVHGRRGCGLRAVPSARPSRLCRHGRRLLLPQQHRDCRAHLRLEHERVAILDVDVHHGNGTQGIFYARPDVLTVSIHADPTAYYPFVWGYAHERGAGRRPRRQSQHPAADRHRRRRLHPGAGGRAEDHPAFAPGALVIALGLDASEHDPLKALPSPPAASAASARRSRAWVCRPYSCRRAAISRIFSAPTSPPCSADSRRRARRKWLIRWPFNEALVMPNVRKPALPNQRLPASPASPSRP